MLMRDVQPPLQNTDVHASSNGIEPGAKREEQEAEGDVDLGPGMFDEDAAGMMNVAAPPPAQNTGGSSWALGRI